ncbi:MAG: hypothetical protein JWP13_44 [Candidatus Saccharibacteria bacterium]|nr:hypothetical protein [Candidatus Saccharibacteria bacterium]
MDTPEITDFIAACRKSSMPDHQIRDHLLARGCARDKVLAALPLTAIEEPLAEQTHASIQSASKNTPAQAVSTELQAFVKKCRQKGLDDTAIARQLQEHGWRPVAIIRALGQNPAPQKVPAVQTTTPVIAKSSLIEKPLIIERPVESTPTQTAATPSVIPVISPKKHHTLKKAVALTGAILIIVSVGLYLLPRQEKPTATAESTHKASMLKDQNYQMTLPAGWKAGSDYNNGAGVNVFYASTSNASEQSRMAIFVTPNQAGQTKDHVTRQIDSLRQNGGAAEILSEEKVISAQSSGTLSVVKATAANNRDLITYYVYFATTYGDTTYNLDVLVPEQQWDNQKTEVIQAVKTFKPLSTSVTHR